MIEEWKDIFGYEGLYQVSNLGNVKSLGHGHIKREKILKPSNDGRGYLKVGLHLNKVKKSRKIHQLVAVAFLNHVPCGYNLVVNHKNLVKTDNRVENLELVTSRENSNLRHVKSSSKYTGVSWIKSKNKWASQIYINGKNISLGLFKNEIDASIAYQAALSNLRGSVS